MSNVELTFKEDEFIISKTDLNGKITYGNEHFISISGYSEKELLNMPHNILRHPDMPSIIFKLLWEHISKGQEIFAYVKNLNKIGKYYWVFAHVTPSFDELGRIIGYHSVRRKPNMQIIPMVESLYRDMLAKEKQKGLQASEVVLQETITKKGFVSYAEFILSI
ncbi:MAG: hypothetical protein RL154_429 [Pseudomonadota bacterium]|jgi:PAS domain S-box-containing protein